LRIGDDVISKAAVTGSGSRRARIGWLAWFVCLLAAAFAVLALILLAARGHGFLSTEGRPYDVLLAFVFATSGALIASSRPRNPIGWIFSTIGLTQGVTEFAGQYAHYALIDEPGSLPGGAAMAWLSSWMWFPGFGLVLTFALLLFPDGRLPSPRWRPVAGLAAASFGLLAVAAVFSWPSRGAHLLGREADSGGVADLIGGGAFILLVVSAFVCAASLIVRLRRSRGIERQQMKWFAYAGVLTVLLLTASIFPSGGWIVDVLQLLAIPLLPTAAAVAIFKYRLYDIDIVINRSLVYGTLTVGVVGIYVGVVGFFDLLMQRSGVGVSLVATGLVAVLFQPIRQRLQNAVNHLLYGERDDPYRVLSDLGRRLEGVAAAEEVLPTVTDSVARALRLPYVAIELRNGRGFETAAFWGDRLGQTQHWSLVHQGETIGRLVVAPRAAGEELSSADRRVLDDVARQASVAAYAVTLTADLRRSRERLRTALEEERRRIRRDLHDGLGPSLATVVVGIEEARNRYANDPHATDALLRDLKQQTQAAIKDIRALVYDLRPPVLDELGLVPALREQAVRFAGRHAGGLTVTVDAPDELPSLPAAVEVGAFRTVQEAVTNVLRHARASRCDIRILVEDGLAIEIADDGVGLADGFRPGVGIHSMRERATELGGALTVTSLPSGTKVEVHFPLERS
jgi:signal transduction histidine kinase